jgi:hypothetical protein
MRNLSKRFGAHAACLALASLAIVEAGIATFGGPPWP